MDPQHDADALLERRTKLDIFIASLEPKFVDTREDVRSAAVNHLADVLQRLPIEFLSPREIPPIAQFFLAKFTDSSALITPSLRGLSAMIRMENVTEETVEHLLQGLFQGHLCQQLRQSDRSVYLEILDTAILKHPQGVRRLGPIVFLSNVVTSIGGERDPRCLLQAFELVPKALDLFQDQTSEKAIVAEDLFEVVACYFPIDFTPAPAADGGTITREDLKSRLEFCLSHNKEFAEFLLPMLLEKAGSDLLAAKLDSLDLLVACCEAGYDNPLVSPYMEEMMDICRQNMLLIYAPQLADRTLDAIAAVTRALEKGSPVYPPTQWHQEIFNAWDSHVKDSKFLSPSSANLRILRTVLGASTIAAEHLKHQIFQQLVFILEEAVNSESRVSRLEIVADVLGDLSRPFTLQELRELASKDLEKRPEVERVLGALLESSMSANEEIAAAAFSALASLAPFLNEKHIEMLCPEVLNVIVKKQGAKTNSSLIRCISSLTRHWPLPVREGLLNPLLKDIESYTFPNAADEDSPIAGGGQGPDSLLPPAYLTSTLVACMRSVADLALGIPFLLKHCATALGSGKSRLFQTFVSTLQKVMEQCFTCEEPSSRDVRSWLLSQEIGDHMLLLVLDPASGGSSPEGVLAADTVVVYSSVRSLLWTWIRVVAPEKRMALLKTGLGFILPSSKSQKEGILCPEKVLILEPLLCSSVPVLPSNVHPSPCASFLCSPRANDRQNLPAVVAESQARCLANLANKLTAEDLRSVLSTVSTLLEDQANESTSMRLAAVALGLALRAHCDAQEWVKKAMLCPSVASLTLMFSPVHVSLTAECGATVRFLYLQRMFIWALPILLAQIASDDSSGYKSLATLLPFIPAPILHTEVEQLFPPLLRSLAVLAPSEDCVLPCLRAFLHLLSSGAALEVVSKQLDSLLPKLLTLATQGETMKLRETTLEILGTVATLDSPELVRHKKEVTSSLAACLDDPKRIVREVAAKTRSRWFFVGAPVTRR